MKNLFLVCLFSLAFGSTAQECIGGICTGHEVYHLGYDYTFSVVKAHPDEGTFTLFKNWPALNKGHAAVADAADVIAVEADLGELLFTGCGVNFCVGHLVSHPDMSADAIVVAVAPTSATALVRSLDGGERPRLRFVDEEELSLPAGFVPCYEGRRFGKPPCNWD